MKAKRILACLLAACIVASLALPVSVLAANEKVEYYYKQARDLLGGNKYLYNTAENGKTNSQIIKEFYDAGDLNWYYLSDHNTKSDGTAYMNATWGIRLSCNVDSWMAIAFRSPGNGQFNLQLEHYVYEWGAEVALAYIIPMPDLAQGEMDAHINKVIAAEAPLGVVDYYAITNGTAATTLGSYHFQSGKEYILVLSAQAGNDGTETIGSASYMYFGKLTATRDDLMPTISTTEAKSINLGTMVTEFGTRTQIAITEVNGFDYYFLPVKGGILQIYNLDYYWDSDPNTDPFVGYVTTDITNAWGCCTGEDGKIYVSGDAKYFYRYDPVTGKGEKVEFLSKYTAAYDISADQYGNVLLGSNSSTTNSGPVYYEAATGKVTTYFSVDKDKVVSDCSALAKDDKYIYAYMEGTVDGVTTRSFFKIDIKIGKTVDELDVSEQMEGVGHLTSATLIDGVLFGGCGGLKKMIAIDVDSFELIDIGIEYGCNGEVQIGENGKAYFIATSTGLCEYDIATRTAKNIAYGYGGTCLRSPGNCFVTVDANGDGKEEKVLATISSNYSMYFFEPTVGRIGAWEGFVRTDIGASTPIRSVVASNDGSNRIFVGGYVTSNCAVYYPSTETASKYVTKGQTDSQVMYNGVLYAGTYSTCTMCRVDPVNGTYTELLSLAQFKQKRIHTIDAGGDKVFFSTIPDTYDLGGYLAWYDINTNEPYYSKLSDLSPLLEDQIVISMAYKDGYLYCGSSVHGGNDSTPTKTDSYFFVLDVASRKIVAIEKVSYPYIASLDVDSNGTVWGVISKTLFTVSYSKSTGIVWTQKYTLDDNTPLTDSERAATGKSGQAMTARTIWFAKDGTIYTNIGYSDGLYQFTVNSKGNVTNHKKLVDGTVCYYALAEDGNLYYASSKNLYMLVLNYTADDINAAVKLNDRLYSLVTDDPSQIAAELNAALNSYNGLSNVEKSFVNRSLLNTARRRLAISLIERLPQTVTAADEDVVDEARQAYNALSSTLQARVYNYEKLLAAEAALGSGSVPDTDLEKPDPSDPDISEPDWTDPGESGGNTEPPDMDDPGTTEPDETLPDSTEPDATEPDATEPDGTGPDTTQPEVTEPDSTEPDTTEPGAKEPDTPGEPEEPTAFPVWASLLIVVGIVLITAACVVLAIPALRKKVMAWIIKKG